MKFLCEKLRFALGNCCNFSAKSGESRLLDFFMIGFYHG